MSYNFCSIPGLLPLSIFGNSIREEEVFGKNCTDRLAYLPPGTHGDSEFPAHLRGRTVD